MNTMKIKFLTQLRHSRYALVCSLCLLTIHVPAKADDMLRLATSLCEAAQTDDRTTMRKKLKSAKLRLRNIFDDIDCGNGNLLRTAVQAGALEAATFIATKVGKSRLSEPDKDGKTVIEWTEGLVAAGDQSKQAFVDLFNSKVE